MTRRSPWNGEWSGMSGATDRRAAYATRSGRCAGLYDSTTCSAIRMRPCRVAAHSTAPRLGQFVPSSRPTTPECPAPVVGDFDPAAIKDLIAVLRRHSPVPRPRFTCAPERAAGTRREVVTRGRLTSGSASSSGRRPDTPIRRLELLGLILGRDRAPDWHRARAKPTSSRAFRPICEPAKGPSVFAIFAVASPG
jgi:hypothetical protein